MRSYAPRDQTVEARPGRAPRDRMHNNAGRWPEPITAPGETPPDERARERARHLARTMTLRLRITIAVVSMLTVGLTVFGVALTSLYSRSLYERLDDRIRASAPLVTARLRSELGLETGIPPFGGDRPVGGERPTGGSPGGPPTVLAPDTYVELRDRNGATLGSGQLSATDDRPKLPVDIDPGATGRRYLTVSSATGDGSWRVLVTREDRFGGATAIVAVPLTEVSTPLERLILIEVLAGIGLLAVLGTGSWLILRHGLRPLEHMADSAASITAGNPGERVSPSDDRTEVGQLGLALNSMLSQIEVAFAERDATAQHLRQFLADASHELRTPLTSIQGFAELFRLGAAEDPEELEIIMRRIEEESDRMKVLVEELLLLARLDETRPPEQVDVDLSVIAADACTDISATAPDRQVTLDAPAPVLVAGDRDHLRQAVANLLTNAVRHTPERTPIEVSAVVEDGFALVSVRDHGPGLDPVAMDHAFDRFWRADDARVGTGTGLGLAIVAAIADEHDGTVSVHNEPGGGARFTIRIPLRGPRLC